MRGRGLGDAASEWPGQYLSTHTVAYSCGILARAGDSVLHSHPVEELQRGRRLANEAAHIMEGVTIGCGDESDHSLDPFFLPANVGDPVPQRLDATVFRTAMRGTVYPEAMLTVEPFEESSAWYRMVKTVQPGGRYQDRVARWQRLLGWFRNHPELHSPVYIGMEEPPTGESFAVVYPKLLLALTESGSLVGLVTCVVWT